MTNTVGVVKIGYTNRDPATRVNEWSRDTGAPGKAEVQYAALVENPQLTERAIHRSLAEYRQANSEWFRCDVSDAVVVLKQHAHVLFEDDRADVAISAKLKQKKIDTDRRLQEIAKEQEKKKAINAQAKNDRLQKKLAEERYLEALAKWEEKPPKTFLEKLGWVLGLSVLVFFVLIMILGAMGIDSWTLLFVLLVLSVVILYWLFSKEDKKPQLKNFMPISRDSSVDYSQREAELSREPQLQTMKSEAAYEYALAKWNRRKPDDIYIFCWMMPLFTMIGFGFLIYGLELKKGDGGYLFFFTFLVSLAATLWTIKLIKKRHRESMPTL